MDILELDDISEIQEGHFVINEFIAKTVRIMKNSDIQIRLPEHRPVEFGQTTTVSIVGSDRFCQTKLADNLIFHVMVFFSLLDSLIDSKYPNLEGFSFVQKYRELPSNDDNELIIKEIFRILRIFRNAITHSKSAITVTDNIFVNYPRGNTQFNLQLNKTSLELIYSVILLVLDDNGYAEQYLHGLMRTYYDDLKSGIIAISDDFGQNNLANVSDGFRLKRIVRYKLTNPEYNLDDSTDVISIISSYPIPPYAIHHYSSDYLIELGGKKYLVPHEVLNTDGTIMLSEIMPWELDDVV